MKNMILILLVVLLFSCNSGKYYANYRYGGKADPAPQTPVEIPDACSPEEPIGHLPEEIDNPDDLTIHQPTLVPVEKGSVIIVTSSYPDTTVASNSSFLTDERFEAASSATIFNGIAALFGFLTLTNANFIWVSAPIYLIGLPFINAIALIYFFVAIYLYASGKMDRPGKKHFWLWVLFYLLSVLIALIPLLMFI